MLKQIVDFSIFKIYLLFYENLFHYTREKWGENFLVGIYLFSKRN
jgi:hypothetical protein